MLIYNYHPLSGEYLGSNEADESPLEPGVFLIPANATKIAPPDPPVGSVPVWVDGAWGAAEDHRGEIWYDAQGSEMTVNQIGDPLTYGLSREPPPPPPPPTIGKIRFALIYQGRVLQTIEWDASNGAMTWQNIAECQMLLDADSKAVLGQPFGSPPPPETVQ